MSFFYLTLAFNVNIMALIDHVCLKETNMANDLAVNGDYIQSLRKKMNWSQKEFGSTVMESFGFKKISLRTIQRIENDTNYRCSKLVVTQLAEIFKIEIESLLQEKNKNEISDKENSKKKVNAIPKKTIVVDNNQSYETKEFFLDEPQIKYLENEFYERLDFSDFSKVKLLIEDLRKCKFQYLNFDSILSITGHKLTKNNYDLFCKAEQKNNSGELNEYYSCKGNLKHRLLSIDQFFDSLNHAHRYSIESDVPNKKNDLEIVCSLVDGIEYLFYKKHSKSDNLKILFDIRDDIDRLSSTNTYLFYDTWKSEYEGWDSDSMTNKNYFNNVVRILIKNHNNPNVLDLDACCDTKWEDHKDSFVNIQWRERSLAENQKSDDQNQDTDQDTNTDIPF